MEDLSKYNEEGSNLRKAQKKMLEILIIVSSICDKHGIPYWLEGGTLLGAVRHGGFIPWDDDLDICVLRKDMKKLRKYLKDELPSGYVYMDRFTEWKYRQLYAKVYDKKSKVHEEDSNGLEYGIFIDIFPVERVFCLKTKKVIDFIYRNPIKGLRGFYGKSFLLKAICGICYIPAALLVCLTRLIVLILRPNYYALPYGKPAYNTIPSKSIFPLKKMEFEKHEFSVPNDADNYLTRLFGDYMKIPPEEKRLSHASSIEFYD